MKIKTEIKNNTFNIKVKIGFNEKFNENELDRLENMRLHEFFKPITIKKHLIVYQGPKCISLAKRLQSPINKHEFYLIINQVITLANDIKKYKLNQTDIIQNLEYIYYHPITKEIMCLYAPIIGKTTFNDLSNLIDKIIYSAIPDEPNDNEFISRFSYFKHGLEVFDINKIEKFIKSEGQNIVTQIDNEINYDQTMIIEDDDATTVLDFDDATTVLDQDDFEMEPEIKYPSLIRIKTHEIFVIDKPNFKVGKDVSEVDYCIEGNRAISRKHIEISNCYNTYYVCDLGSCNHTYINDNIIQPEVKTEIHDGDILRLADEEFEFTFK